MVTGGVGAVGAAFDAPLEHAVANAANALRKNKRVTPINACLAEAVNNVAAKADRGRAGPSELPYHDCRSVVMGSTDAARRAGRKQAASATAASSAGTVMNVIGSSVPTP